MALFPIGYLLVTTIEVQEVMQSLFDCRPGKNDMVILDCCYCPQSTISRNVLVHCLGLSVFVLFLKQYNDCVVNNRTPFVQNDRDP